MNEQNRAIAQQFLEKLGSGAPPIEIASMMSEDVSLEIQGDVTALPWIGARVGREAIADFVRDSRELVVPETFRVDDVLVSATRAVILGELSSTLKRNRKTMKTYFAFILTITGAMIVRLQMLEDSYAVSQAAR